MKPSSARIFTSCFALLVSSANAAPASSGFHHRMEKLGTVEIGLEKHKTEKGTLNFVGRIVDSVKVATPDGCHVGFAITNSPSSPKLHVVIDGARVAGFDDVEWHSLALSPDGKHHAFAATVHGKKVCVRDSVAGKTYEKIEGSAGEWSRLVFSPDSQHLGYAAFFEGKWHMVLDGDEGPGFAEIIPQDFHQYSIVKRAGHDRWERTFSGIAVGPVFSPDSSRWFYLGEQRDSSGGRTTSFVLNGRDYHEHPGVWGSHLFPDGRVAYIGVNGFKSEVVVDGVRENEPGASEFVFSADGKHYAYVGGNPREGKVTVVVDGKSRGVFHSASQLELSADGAHFAFNTYDESTGYRAVLDGEVLPFFKQYRQASVRFSGDGKRYAVIGESNRDAGNDKVVLVDCKIVEKLPDATSIYLDPDLQVVAYIHRGPEGSSQVSVNGKDGPPLVVIGDEDFRFSPDGTRCAYVAMRADGKYSVVVDGIEGPIGESVDKNSVQFSSDSAHVAYELRLPGKSVVVVDRVMGPMVDQVDLQSFHFGSGGRLAYVAQIGSKYCVVTGTTPGPQYDVVRSASIAFSNDGKHIGYIAGTSLPEDRIRALLQTSFTRKLTDEQLAFQMQRLDRKRFLDLHVVVDGVEGPAASEIDRGPVPNSSVDDGSIQFTEDSRHWFYVASMTGKKRVVIDGVPGPEYFSVVAGPVLRRDGKLEYLALNGPQESPDLLRVTVDGLSTK